MTRARFTQERRVFDRLRSDCSPEDQKEFERAVRTLVERYNTTIRENRFIVGGVVEVFTCALLKSVGIECDQAAGGILLPRDGRKLSVKSNFTGLKGGIRLLNQMGEGRREWNTATLFVIAGTGIVFGAPDMVDSPHVKSTGDALELRAPGLRSLASDPSNVLPMEIACKPPTETAGRSRKASADVAREILLEMGLNGMLAAFKPADGREIPF